ncbi:MAG TPA: PEP-CTERM sorting domain-containing protein [Thermosynechococcaceae cyanobacterium]
MTRTFSPAIFAAVGLTIASIGAALPASAATFNCPTSIADNVSGTSACQYSDTATQDSVSPNKPLTVNEEKFFGLGTWKFGGKIGENTGFQGQGSGQEGIWNIAQALQPAWQSVMLVFKSGQGTSLVGYQLQKGVTSGTWDSPFENSLFDVRNPKDVSHISVYFAEGAPTGSPGGNAAAVPEPTTMAGLALAGAGLAAYRRRSATKAQG